jgi:hypothetical protein
MAIIGADTTITDVRDAAIMLGIANRADDDGQGARPDLAELARWGRCSTSTVKRRLRALEATGQFTRVRERRKNGRLGWWTYALTQRSLRAAPGKGDQGSPMMTPGPEVTHMTPGPETTHMTPGPETTPVYDLVARPRARAQALRARPRAGERSEPGGRTRC